MQASNNPNQHHSLTWEEHEARCEAALNLILPMTADEIVDFYLREATVEDSILWDPLCRAFHKLAATNPDTVRAVYVGLAQRENPKERWFGAFHIIDLTPLDHDLGMHFWEKFMRDPDPKVRELAFNSLEERLAVHNLEDQDGESFRELGITWQDACNLYRAHINPSQRGLYAGLGGTSLGQPVDLPSHQ
jgi:hypothetical protein